MKRSIAVALSAVFAAGSLFAQTAITDPVLEHSTRTIVPSSRP
jgi:hypothetical protein